MAPINFAGKLPVAVVLQWKGDIVSGAVTTSFEQFRYVVANDLLSAFTISVGGATPTTITRKATTGKPQFDKVLNTYTTDPASGTALDELIAGGSGVPCTIDMTITFHRFFDVLLQQMTRTDADLRNLANPNNSAAILATFVHRSAVVNINTDYVQKTEKLKGVPCRLVDKTVTPRPGKAPAVKLVFELDFTPVNDTGREVMRKLIAMDWGRLAKFGKEVKAGQTMAPDVQVWFSNRNVYVLNHADLDRGEKFRLAILARHDGKSPLALATDLRNDIDRHLITANHWGQAREDLKRERHQLLLSDLFGTLHRDAWLASPVNCLRVIEDLMTQPAVNARARLRPNNGMSPDEVAGLALQFGVGHCGEHATVSFSILKSMVSNTGSPVLAAVRTGFANSDHAFVVYNLNVLDVVKTIPTNPANTRVQNAALPLTVWNLPDAIAANPNRAGFVMDPYLDTTVMKATAAELLTALKDRDRRRKRKDTDWLAFDDEFFLPLGLTVEDITAAPAAERANIVQNV